MKLSRFKKHVTLALAYFLIFYSLIFFAPEYFMDDSIEYILFPISLTFLALYIILYKKNWVVLPAKIIFSTILLITFFVLRGGYYFEYSDIIRFLPSALPLIYLYKNDFKKWLIFLKSKPFFNFKKILEISRQSFILIFLGLTVVLTSTVFIFSSYKFWGIGSYSIIILVLLVLYLLLKNSLLKMFIGVYILIWCIFSFRDLFQLLVYDGIYNVKWMMDDNSLTEGVLICANKLVFPVFALLVIFKKSKKGLV